MTIEVGSSKWMEMMKNRELVHWKTNIDEVGYELDYIDDLRMIQFTAFENGFDISLIEAQDIWEEFSDSVCASWLIVGTDLSTIWSSIKIYFPEKKSTTLENLESYLNNSEHKIDFNVSEREK